MEELFEFPEDRAVAFQRMMYNARKSRGWTQAQAAEQAGVSQSTVNVLELGPPPGMKLVPTVKVLKAYDISLDHAAQVLGLLPSPDLDELEDEQKIQEIVIAFARLPREKRKMAEASIKALIESLK